MHFQDGTVALELLAQPLDLFGDLDLATEMHSCPHQTDEFQHAPALPGAELVEVDLLARRECGRLLFDDAFEPADRSQQAAHLVRSRRARAVVRRLATDIR